MNTELFIGIVGATIVLIPFVLNQLHIWKDTDLLYDLSNVVGGGLLIIYGYITEAWPFVLLNVVWTAVALYDVVRYFMHGKTVSVRKR